MKDHAAILAAALAAMGGHQSGATHQEDAMRRFRVTVNGQPYDVSVEEVREAQAPVSQAAAARPEPPAGRRVEAPMPGRILDVRVDVGSPVVPGSVVLVLEAMKMENDILADSAGKISAVHVKPGDAVNTGDPLVEME